MSTQYFRLDRKELITLTGLSVLALTVRIFLFYAEPIITTDGIGYTESGVNLVTGRGYVAGGEYQGRLEPLYPILTGLTYLAVGDARVSGALVSAVFGALLVWPLFLFSRAVYHTRVAFVGALLLVFYPFLSNYASTALTEATYTFFLFAAAYAGWIAYRRRSLASYLGCGVLAGLAYLTRFEAVGFLLVFVVWRLLASRGREAKLVAAMVAVFCAVIAPFHVYNWVHAGSPLFLGRLHRAIGFQIYVQSLEGLESTHDYFFKDVGGFVQRYIKNLGDAYTNELPTLFPPLLIMLATVGVFEGIRDRTFGAREIYLGAMVLINLLGYPVAFASGRNLTYGLPYLLMLLAKGMWDVARLGATRAAEFTRKRVTEGAVLAVVIAVVSMFALPQTFRPLLLGRDPLSPWELMELGNWMREALPPQERIMASGRQVAFYAGASFVPYPLRYEDLIAEAQAKGIEYVVIGSYRAPDAVALDALLKKADRDSGMELLREVRKRSGWARLYRVAGARAGAGTPLNARP